MATTPIVIDKNLLVDVLPVNVRTQLTSELFAELIDIKEDTQVLETYRDTLIGFTQVLKSGSYTLRDYGKACRYVTFRLLGDNQKIAYIRTFPDRYKEFKAKGFTDKQISARTSMYAKGKLVKSIEEVAHIPAWLANADNFQKAVNHQVFLMENAESERVQTDAANSIMTHLKRPDKVEIEHSTSEETTSVIGSLVSAAEKIVAKQQLALANGSTAKQVIAENIIEGETHE